MAFIFRNNEYNKDRSAPIPNDTILTLNSAGQVINAWGKDFFFLPHMITIDSQNNFWMTDVALHQVFKFEPYGGKTKQPLVTLGIRVRVTLYFWWCFLMALR